MDGPQHYQEAERLLEAAAEPALIARSQVHALLALTAATAISTPDSEEAWTRATRTKPGPLAEPPGALDGLL